jgi:DNA polymerase V
MENTVARLHQDPTMPEPSPTRISDIFTPDTTTHYRIPLLTCPVEAGFPSPADDWVEDRLDLNKHLIKHPAATFFVRVSGYSMTGAGIHPGDILVVDRALEPTDGKVIIAVVDGELTVKRVKVKQGKLFLMPDNPDYPALAIEEETDFSVWGVVSYVIHSP